MNGIAELHRVNIMHRDIKVANIKKSIFYLWILQPANIIVATTANNQTSEDSIKIYKVKLIDLGFATVAGSNDYLIP